jgi:uncharacterized protein (TIGR02599 family)
MNVSPNHPNKCAKKAFTLVEVLVSLAVLAVLLTIIAQVLGQVQRVWSSANAKVSQFREARRAMDRISTTLAQATMNTYLQYFYPGPNPFVPPAAQNQAAPLGYVRFSELQFITGPTSKLLGGSGTQFPGHSVFFQAPLGGELTVTAGGVTSFVNMPTALSACGYYITYGTDRSFRPAFLNQRSHPERLRFRLLEYRPPIEANTIYKDITLVNNNPGQPDPNWYRETGTWSRPVAENIIYLVISPKRPVTDDAGDPRDIASNYEYDSSANGVRLAQTPQDFQLPPLVEVTLIALDEDSARRFAESSGGTPSLPLGLFGTATDARFRSDLQEVEQFFNDQKLNYRIFTATVPIRNSKWGL